MSVDKWMFVLMSLVLASLDGRIKHNLWYGKGCTVMDDDRMLSTHCDNMGEPGTD